MTDSYQVTAEAHAAAKAGTEPYPGAKPAAPEAKPPEVKPEVKPAAPEVKTEAKPEAKPEEKPAAPEAKPDEKKEGEEKKPEPEAKADEGQEGALDYPALYSEFAEHGDLSEESVATIKKALPGVTDDLISQYLTGLKATNTQATNEALAVAGGQDRYTAMTAWAAQNLTPTEVAEFNSALTRGMEPAKFAISGLRARFEAASGGAAEPDLTSTGAPAGGDPPIGSRQELMLKIRDPKFAKDPAFRKSVEDQLARSVKSGRYTTF